LISQTKGADPFAGERDAIFARSLQSVGLELVAGQLASAELAVHQSGGLSR